MPKFIIHSRSICHVTHLLEVEADDPDDAVEVYDAGECDAHLIGVQIGDNVDLLDSDLTTAHTAIQGVYIPYPDPDPSPVWAEEAPDHPIEDWQYEVANDDTRLGYWEWVKARGAEE